jgi:hypothetical protein
VIAAVVLGRLGPAALRRRDVRLAVILGLLPATLWYLHARALYLSSGNTFGLLSGGDSKFGTLADWLSAGFYLSLARLELKWVFAGPAALVAVLGLALALKRGRPAMLLAGVPTIALYYMIVGRYAREEWGIQYHVFALPFAALAVGIGCEWLLGLAARRLGAAVVGVTMLALSATSAYVYADMLGQGTHPLVACGETVARLVPRGERIIVSSTSASRVGGVPNNYQEPVIFFYGDRSGWSLPADDHSPERVAEWHRAGARYFVVYSPSLYRNRPGLAAYLNTHADQVGPGLDAGCAIFRLR